METISTIYAGSVTIPADQPKPTEQNYTFENSPFSEGQNIAVIPMIQTRNGVNTPNLRIWDITPTGFKYHIDEINGSNIKVTDADGKNPQVFKSLAPQGNPYHASETMAFIAFVC